MVKKGCIRPFEAGTAFTHYGNNTDSTQAAYMVVSADKSKAEVFFALTNKPVLMDATVNMEVDIDPILFENKTEMVDIIFRNDVYYIRYKKDPKFFQEMNVSNGLSTLLKN